MKERGVVPDDDVADAVFQPQLVLLARRMALQLIQEIDGLVLGHAFDAERATRHRIERLATRHRMLADDGMAHPRHLLFLLLRKHGGYGARGLVLIVSIAVMVQRD